MEIISKKTQEDYNTLIEDTQSFIDNVISSKYTTDEEKNYDDIINNRFKNELKNIEPNESRINKMIQLMLDKKFIPAGSILSGFGLTNSRKVTLSNCYYIPIEHDSLDGIYETKKRMAKVYSRRGGCGTSLTVLRPKNSPVKNAAKYSTGAVSFLPGFSLDVHDIGQSGRRGAALADIDCRHPDLLDFIWCKSKPEQVFPKDQFSGVVPNVNFINLSVQITDEFMNAVNENKEWELFFPDIEFDKYKTEWDGNYDKWIHKGYPTITYQTLNAREILKQIAEASWLTGDPGILFRNQAQTYSTGYFDSKLCPVGVNPCGEQWLQKYGNCLLASFVMYKYVKNPYTKEAEFDIDLFLDDVKYAVCFLDNMIDVNKKLHPWEEQRETDEYGRRIGIETTGVHDMLAMLNIEYGSDKSIEFLNDIYFSKAVEEIKASIELAKEKGCAPCLKTKKSRTAFVNQPYIKRIFSKLLRNNHEKIKTDILKHGIRNSAFNTNGPTGTLSLIAGNCSSGIEPIYEIEYYRESRVSKKKIRVLHLPLVKYAGPKILDLDKEEIIKQYHYTPAHEMDFSKRIRVQGIIQKWTDSSISSTINLKNQASIEDIYNIYVSGWKTGLKGITIFRDGCKKGVLTTTDDNENEENNQPILTNDEILKYLNNRKEEMMKTQRGYRYIKFWKKIKVYITVTIGNDGKPLEIFANVPYEAGMNKDGIYQSELFMEKKSYWDTICRMTSLLLRLNVPIELIVKQLEKSSPAMTELPNIINHVLKNFIIVDEEKIEKIKNKEADGEYCPECKKNGIIYQGGCMTCVLCGYNKCG